MKSYAGIGSKETPSDILMRMKFISKKLSDLGWNLRSGGAPGADSAFEEYAIVKEIFLPWNGFNDKRVDNVEYFCSLENEHFELASKYHPVWNKLSSGSKKLHARNTQQVLGIHLNSPSQFIVCWTKDGLPSGGTGQALRIAMDFDIPICNLKNENFSEFIVRTGIKLR